MLVHEFIENSAKRLPDKIALICNEQRLTYQQINDLSNQMALRLSDMGIKHQDRVAIFLENSVEAVISLFGILKTGAIFVMLNPGMKAKKLNYILQDSSAGALIAHTNKTQIIKDAVIDAPELDRIIWCTPKGSDQIPKLATCNSQHETRKSKLTTHNLSNENHGNDKRSCFHRDSQLGTQHLWNDLFSEHPSLPAFKPPASLTDLATIIYTSGSTGKPKGVMSAHHNVVAAASIIIQYLENVEDDIILNVLPLHFDYGLYQVLMAFLFGGTIVLEKSFAYPYRIIERIVEERITGLPIVPTIAALLLQIKELDKFDFSHIRYITNTADVLPKAYIRKMQNVFPHAKVFSMYGLTECKRVSYLPPAELDARPGSVGKPIPNVEAFIVNEMDQEVDNGVTGELVVCGPNVMQGYWNDPDETAQVFLKGRKPGETLLYTGDLFRKDKEGFLYFVARKDDLIKIKGQRVSPREIERVLCELDNVIEAAATGIPDETAGHSIKAIIVSGNGNRLNQDLIFDYCRKNLEPFMVPSHIEFRSSLPKLSNGKIDKKQLKKNYN